MSSALMRRSLASLSAAAAKNQAAAASQVSLFNPSTEMLQLRQSVRAFAQQKVAPGARERDANERFDMGLFKQCGDMGLLGVTVQEEYGGSGMDATAACIIHEELGAVDQGFCLSYLAHSMLFVNNLARNGNNEQKQKFLPSACDGSTIGGMGMSEPGYGTDVLGMQTNAKRGADGKWVLNGRKFWITNAHKGDDKKTPGDIFLVYAKTGKTDKEVSLFLVDGKSPGFSVGQRISGKCGMRASPTGELVFDNVVVPHSALVGEENKAVVCMMRNLEIERVVLAAMATGLARTCLEVMNRYATERVAFKKPIREFGQVQKHLAESYAKLMAARTYLFATAAKMDLDKEGQRLDTDGVKLICTTLAKEIADSAIQVLGGAGYIADYPVERLWRDSKLLEIGGGTLESHQKNMTREMKNITTFD